MFTPSSRLTPLGATLPPDLHQQPSRADRAVPEPARDRRGRRRPGRRPGGACRAGGRKRALPVAAALGAAQAGLVPAPGLPQPLLEPVLRLPAQLFADGCGVEHLAVDLAVRSPLSLYLSLIHISEPTRR